MTPLTLRFFRKNQTNKFCQEKSIPFHRRRCSTNLSSDRLFRTSEDVLRTLRVGQEGADGPDLVGGSLGQEADQGSRLRDQHRNQRRRNSGGDHFFPAALKVTFVLETSKFVY